MKKLLFGLVVLVGCIPYGPGLTGPTNDANTTCSGLSNCCVCATTGACSPGACSHPSGWETAIKDAVAGDTILLSTSGNYTPSGTTIDVPSGGANNVITIARYNTALPVLIGTFRPGSHTRVHGVKIDGTAQSYALRIKAITSTPITDVAITYSTIVGGTTDGVNICGNVNNVQLSANLIDGGQHHHAMKMICANATSGSECDSGGGNEPADCVYLPRDYEVSDNIIQRVSAYTYTDGEDLIQLEGTGPGIIAGNRLTQNATGEDCLDIKGYGGFTSGVLAVTRNDIDATGCQSEGVIVHGTWPTPSKLFFDWNHVKGTSSDGLTMQNQANIEASQNYFEGALARLTSTNVGTSAWYFNTFAGGKLSIGDATHCPDEVVYEDNIFSGVVYDLDAACRGITAAGLANNLVYNGSGGELRVCNTSSALCTADTQCGTGGVCLSAAASDLGTLLTSDPLLTGYHIAASSPARDAAGGGAPGATDLDGQTRCTGVCDRGADEVTTSTTTTTSTSTTSTSIP